MKVISLLLICLCCSNALAWTLTGRVLYVDSGDTLTVRDGNGFHSQVRLRGIDAPATGTPYGGASKDELMQSLSGRFVVVDYNNRDNLHGVIGTVRLSGEDMNLRQLYAGLARYDQGMAAGLSIADQNQYAQAETEARENRRGMWADSGTVQSESPGRTGGSSPTTAGVPSRGWGGAWPNQAYPSWNAPSPRAPGNLYGPGSMHVPGASPWTRRPWGW